VHGDREDLARKLLEPRSADLELQHIDREIREELSDVHGALLQVLRGTRGSHSKASTRRQRV
jgi:hypothetical protein